MTDRPHPLVCGEQPASYRTVAIVGGGLTGLVAAWRLADAGARVTVFEAAQRPGGMAGSTAIRGVPCDRQFQEILPGDRHFLALIEALGLTHRLRWRPWSTVWSCEGRLTPVQSIADLGRVAGLTGIEQLRLLAGMRRAAAVTRLDRLEAVNALDWLRRYCGDTVTERALKPLLRSALGSDAGEASAAFVQPLIARLHARHDRARCRIASLEGGMTIVLHALVSRLNALEVDIRCDAQVDEIASRADGVVVKSMGTMSEAFDDVVLTLAPAFAARLLPRLPTPMLNRFQGVPMRGFVQASFLVTGRLAEADIIEHDDATLPFGRIVQRAIPRHDARCETRQPDAPQPEHRQNDATASQRTLVYATCWQSSSVRMTADDMRELRSACLRGLVSLFPGFDVNRVRGARFTRLRHAIGVTVTGYSRSHLPPMRTGLPGVFYLNTAQVAQGVLGVEAVLGLLKDRVPSLIRAIEERHGPVALEAGAPAIIGGGPISAAQPLSRPQRPLPARLPESSGDTLRRHDAPDGGVVTASVMAGAHTAGTALFTPEPGQPDNPASVIESS